MAGRHPVLVPVLRGVPPPLAPVRPQLLDRVLQDHVHAVVQDDSDSVGEGVEVSSHGEVGGEGDDDGQGDEGAGGQEGAQAVAGPVLHVGQPERLPIVGRRRYRVCHLSVVPFLPIKK